MPYQFRICEIIMRFCHEAHRFLFSNFTFISFYSIYNHKRCRTARSMTHHDEITFWNFTSWKCHLVKLISPLENQFRHLRIDFTKWSLYFTKWRFHEVKFQKVISPSHLQPWQTRAWQTKGTANSGHRIFKKHRGVAD